MEQYTLQKLEQFSRRKGPLVLIIMDGVGIGENNEKNALHLADTPFLDKIRTECIKNNLYIQLKAHGTAVGLPTDKEMGNSEVGHNALGTGRIVKQRATLAKEAILSRNLFKTDKWQRLMEQIKNGGKTLHLMGLLSDGYVHSHISHLIGLLYGARDSKVKKVRIHALLDGRDVPPQSALNYIDQLEQELKQINNTNSYDYQIASGGGRMRVTMDRYYSDWEVVRRGWDAHVCAIPEQNEQYEGYFKSAGAAIRKARENNPEISDQYLPSFVIIDQDEQPLGKMGDGDVVINFNFRGDRAIEISQAFDDREYRFIKKCAPNVFYYGLLQYDKKIKLPHNYFIDPPEVEDSLSVYLCNEQINQFAIAETHKYGHITYFWNGNKEGYVCKQFEEYIEIESDPSEMIESHPKMKAVEVKDKLIEVLDAGSYNFLRVNWANGDMVGHTGNIEAAIEAAEIVDQCVKETVEKVMELKGIAVITADHGNLEEMDDMHQTAHSLNPVMFAIVDSKHNEEYRINDKIKEPGLGNVAATMLNLMGYKKPETFMDSLIKLY
ncbi:MAG: putative 2,3-bisphosphoglycerate-independent phosphoglycerate mutase [Promethearchaeota archaeon]|nr:MAG: putative 2,3-bisphosphoglycerate-independent phosphoglycerate mutase [Candidatus Lokiarchaeota archaeon]